MLPAFPMRRVRLCYDRDGKRLSGLQPWRVSGIYHAWITQITVLDRGGWSIFQNGAIHSFRRWIC